MKKLQSYLSLGLDKFFKKNNIFFTGYEPKIYSKPNIESLRFLSIEPEKSVFFGDREVDKQFSKNSKMQFQKEKVMKIV